MGRRLWRLQQDQRRSGGGGQPRCQRWRNASFAAGIDYRVAPGTVLGFALAGGGTKWDLAQGLGGGDSRRCSRPGPMAPPLVRAALSPGRGRFRLTRRTSCQPTEHAPSSAYTISTAEFDAQQRSARASKAAPNIASARQSRRSDAHAASAVAEFPHARLSGSTRPLPPRGSRSPTMARLLRPTRAANWAARFVTSQIPCSTSQHGAGTARGKSPGRMIWVRSDPPQPWWLRSSRCRCPVLASSSMARRRVARLGTGVSGRRASASATA